MEKHVTALLLQLSVGAQDDLRSAVKERLRAKARGSSSSSGSGSSNDPPGGGLGDGVLERNLGVPMVVVGCKADSLQSETFEQQQRLHFIQQSLRRFCLKCEPLGFVGNVGGERVKGLSCTVATRPQGSMRYATLRWLIQPQEKKSS